MIKLTGHKGKVPRKQSLRWKNSSLDFVEAMDSSTISLSPPQNGEIYCICDNAYHKQEPCFPLFKLGHIVILP